jgi:arginine-tRNA-protein transferase
MDSLFRFVAPPSRCGYLPTEQWSLEYEYVGEMSRAEYLQRMLEGWRRFGHMLFRPACESCRACRPLRILVNEFSPNRSQRRCRQLNEGVVELRIDTPSVTRAKLDLYDRYHSFQADHKGWPEHAPKDAEGYAESYVFHPFDVEEWCYYLDGQLVGVGYVDYLPDEPGKAKADRPSVTGLSAVYFFYDPDQRERGLGTWNVLSLLDEARRRALPYVYMGYSVAGCRSMEYKTRFVPNEVRDEHGQWRCTNPRTNEPRTR